MVEGPYNFTGKTLDLIRRHHYRAAEAHSAWEKHRASLGIPGRTDQATYTAGYMQAIRDMEARDA